VRVAGKDLDQFDSAITAEADDTDGRGHIFTVKLGGGGMLSDRRYSKNSATGTEKPGSNSGASSVSPMVTPEYWHSTRSLTSATFPFFNPERDELPCARLDSPAKGGSNLTVANRRPARLNDADPATGPTKPNERL